MMTGPGSVDLSARTHTHKTWKLNTHNRPIGRSLPSLFLLLLFLPLRRSVVVHSRPFHPVRSSGTSPDPMVTSWCSRRCCCCCIASSSTLFFFLLERGERERSNVPHHLPWLVDYNNCLKFNWANWNFPTIVWLNSNSIQSPLTLVK